MATNYHTFTALATMSLKKGQKILQFRKKALYLSPNFIYRVHAIKEKTYETITKRAFALARASCKVPAPFSNRRNNKLTRELLA